MMCTKCFGRVDLYHGHMRKDDGTAHIFEVTLRSQTHFYPDSIRWAVEENAKKAAEADMPDGQAELRKGDTGETEEEDSDEEFNLSSIEDFDDDFDVDFK
jgi:hypothetical protein